MAMKAIRNILVALPLALLIGCAVTPSAPQQTLEERAQARWDHLIAGEAEPALAYYTPGYRSITATADFDAWLRNRPVKWISASVKESECLDEERCTITSSVTYRVPGGPTGINQMRMTRDIEEEWIRLDGQWFYVQN